MKTFFKGLSHLDVIKHYGVNYDTLESTREQMKFFADLEKNITGIWWVVCSADNTTFYGAGGLKLMNILQGSMPKSTLVCRQVDSSLRHPK